ncbi:hypothetical protein MMC32_004113 [Xylographa parallela]|nr:hypothetical protein [Xylographa parallela]
MIYLILLSFHLQKSDGYLDTFPGTNYEFDPIDFSAKSPAVRYEDTSLVTAMPSPYSPAIAPAEWSLGELINPFPGNVAYSPVMALKSPSATSTVAEVVVHEPRRARSHACTHSACVLLPHFTSKGDLTRHQREIHENGGSKAFFCPHYECKRSTGTPFKRKENLKEHLRRVHRGVAAAVDDNDKVDEPSALVRVSSVPHLDLSRSLELKERSETRPLSIKTRKRRLEPESQGTNMAPGTHDNNVDEASEAQVKRLKQLIEKRDTELKIITTERDMLRKAEIGKDAQIRLLKDMVQNRCSGQP